MHSILFWSIFVHFDSIWSILIHSDIAEEPEEGLTSEDEGSEGSRGSTPKIVNNLTANPNLSISAASNVSSSIVSSTASLNSLTRWSNSSLYTTGNGNTTSQNNQITPILTTNVSKTTVQQTLSNQSSGNKKSNLIYLPSLIHFDPLRSIMIHFWSILILFDPFWSILIHFDPSWSILIHFDPFWSIFRFYSNLINDD